MLDSLRHDVAYTLRTLRRAPGFTAVAVLTLALGIGATTAVVSVVNGVLLRGLPYRDPATLMWASERADDGNTRLPSYPTFRDWEEQLRVGGGAAVEGMAYVRGGMMLYRGEVGPERLLSASVTPGFFSLLGTPALLGRTFRPDEERADANRVVVLSYALWQRRFGGDPGIVGRTISLDSTPVTVVGVMPRGFGYPTWASLWAPIAPRLTTDSVLARRGVHSDSRTVIRLRTASDSARAASMFRTVQTRLAAEYPAENEHWSSVSLMPLRNEVLGDVGPTLLTLAAAAALVLLLACLNVATLSLIRASVRARELVVRAALGAGRGRLARQLFAESSAIAFAGAALGVLLASVAVRYVRQTAAVSLPRADEIAVDARVLVAALGTAIVAAILVGTAPVLRATRPVIGTQLRGGQRGSTGGRLDARVRGGLVALQFACTVVLLVACALLLQSFRRVQDVPLGIDAEQLVAIGISPPKGKYDDPAAALALYDRLRDAARSVPGVRDAALVNHLPLTGSFVISPVTVAGRPDDGKQSNQVIYRTASAEYLRTTGMRLARGRWFSDDDMRSPDAAGFVINQAMASQFWPDGNPVGQVITLRRSSQDRPDFGQPISGAVIGIVADVHQFGKDAAPAPEVFVPYTREVWPWITLVVRAGSPERVIPALRQAVLQVDPAIPVAGQSVLGGTIAVKSLLSDSLARRRLSLSLIGAFGVAALILAAIGLYGVIAYSVEQRTKEIGIRAALGATRGSIVRLVLGSGVRVAAIGVVVGLLGARAAAQLIQSILFETTPSDLASYAAVPILLAAVALLASYWPARRAVRVDPAVAMRDE